MNSHQEDTASDHTLAISEHANLLIIPRLRLLILEAQEDAQSLHSNPYNSILITLLTNTDLPNDLFAWLYDNWSNISSEKSFIATVSELAQIFAASDIQLQSLAKLKATFENSLHQTQSLSAAQSFFQYKVAPQTVCIRASARLLTNKLEPLLLGNTDETDTYLQSLVNMADDKGVVLEIVTNCLMFLTANQTGNQLVKFLLARFTNTLTVPCLWSMPCPLLIQLCHLHYDIWEAYLTHLIHKLDANHFTVHEEIKNLMSVSQSVYSRTMAVLEGHDKWTRNIAK